MLDLTDWQNKKFTTRDGRSVRLFCVNANCIGGETIVGLALNADGTTKLCSWHKNGMYYSTDGELDLINAKTKKEGWVNVYPSENCTLYTSEVSANRAANSERLACVKIEWEE